MKKIFLLSSRLCLGFWLIWTFGLSEGALATDTRNRNAAEALQSLTDAVKSVRTNAVPDLSMLLTSLKAQYEGDHLVVQELMATELMRRQVGPYVLLPRQHGAILTLRVWASEAGPLVPILIDSLGSEDLVLASASAAALGVMGRHASSALPALMNAAKSERPALSRNAVAALGDISGSNPEIVALLMKILKESRDMFTRENAVISLGKQGEMAAEASAMLRGLLYEPERIAMHAARSLASIAPDDPDTLKAFEEMLQNHFHVTRLHAIRGLGRLGGGESVIKLLKTATTDPWPYNSELATSIIQLHEKP